MADVVSAQPRMIDRNGHRWGATISAAVLLIGFVFDVRLLAPIIAVILGISSFFGLRFSVLGLLYRSVKRAFKLTIPVEPEEEMPPRFAQLLGFVFLGLATLGFYVFGSAGLGWTLTLIVAGLQALLGVTGICVGCEMYLYGKKLAAARQA
ncbi:MAG TPA: DUF4395 domain-containing protein [Actinomycetota bacterium]|jgi:hypothetical protein